jgi:hypothetical protein
MPSIKLRKYLDSVYVIYTHKTKIFKIFTGVKVEDKYWNTDSIKKNCPDYDKIVRQITDMESRVLNASMKVRGMRIDPTVDRVRAEFYNQFKKEVPEEKTFWNLYDEYFRTRIYNINSRLNPIIYKKLVKQSCTFQGYEMDIVTWDQINFGRLIQFLLFEKREDDEFILDLVKCLKTFMKSAYPQKDLIWMKYQSQSEFENVVVLENGELKNLIDSDLGGYLEETRDLFVFLVTSGMKYHESQVINPSWITPEEKLKLKQLKTSGELRPYLNEVSRRILIKYDNIPPQISLERFNDQLKELFMELKLDRAVAKKTGTPIKGVEILYPLYEVINADIAESSFIALNLLNGVSFPDIMIMSGHSDYKTLIPYLKFERQYFRQQIRKEADKLNYLFGKVNTGDTDPLNN